MYKEKINFEVRPIFNLTQDMCKDFADIDLQCGELVERNIRHMCRDLDKTYFDVWRLSDHSFAFAAYSGENLVGFTSGFMNGNNMFTNALYVTPKYHNCGIGSGLLNTSEQAASLIVHNMQLVPLENAISFYQERDYKNVLIQGRIHKIKKLPKLSAGIVPVFGWSDKLSTKLNIDVDTNLLKQSKHQPIFVYVNGEQKIDGVATRLSNGEDYVKFTRKGGDVAKYRAMELTDALYNTR